jgi:hypothetical protein
MKTDSGFSISLKLIQELTRDEQTEEQKIIYIISMKFSQGDQD